MDYQYTFKNKETGINRVAQSWSEFFDLQRNSSEWLQLSNLGWNTKSTHFQSYELEKKLNEFWSGALGYEKTNKLKLSGICGRGSFNGIRIFLRDLHNRSCMEGDNELIKKIEITDKQYWEFNDIKDLTQGQATTKMLCLPVGNETTQSSQRD